MPYINGYNLGGYSPDPDHVHAFGTLGEAREDHADTLKRWADECVEQYTPHLDEADDLLDISGKLAGDAETVAEWICEDGGATSTHGPDGNDYTFWTHYVDWPELAQLAGFDDDRSDPTPGDQADILDAYNGV